MAAATELKTHTFHSRGREERLIRRPEIKVPGPLGQQQHLQDAVRYTFGPNGTLTVFEGQDVLEDGPLDPATLKPTAQDALAWLRAHPQLNQRFHEEGREPDRLLPTEDDFLELVTEAAATLQRGALVELLEQERSGHGRALLVNATERAIAQVDKMQAALDEADAAKAK